MKLFESKSGKRLLEAQLKDSQKAIDDQISMWKTSIDETTKLITRVESLKSFLPKIVAEVDKFNGENKDLKINKDRMFVEPKAYGFTKSTASQIIPRIYFYIDNIKGEEVDVNTVKNFVDKMKRIGKVSSSKSPNSAVKNWWIQISF
jgi:hypothetical protein